jgi:hypothetical protein
MDAWTHGAEEWYDYDKDVKIFRCLQIPKQMTLVSQINAVAVATAPTALNMIIMVIAGCFSYCSWAMVAA